MATRATEPLWRDTGLAVVAASAAFAQQRWREAAELLDPVMPRITTIGGSDAQDDLFRQMYAVALNGCGRTADARNYLAANTAAGKVATPLDAHLAGAIPPRS